MTSMSVQERLQAELDILQAMYPEQVSWDPKAQDFSYNLENGALVLRLSKEYLNSEMPTVISAHAGKTDLRNEMRRVINDCEKGAEILDAVLLAFHDLLESSTAEVVHTSMDDNSKKLGNEENGKATVVIWLHHLLNTNKRKQCLSVPAGIAGVTKPGYPGVLTYAGDSDAVYQHVNELKQLNWAAFQVRLETCDAWNFAHGEKVIEVESMSELVAELGDHKNDFLEAMRMK